jgi:hypothetical protein
MRDQREKPPAKCVLTWIGLAAIASAAACFVITIDVQLVKTGSFDRGEGFVMGPYLGSPMLYSLAASLPILVVGGIVDSLRYGRWVKSRQTP